MSTAAKTTTEQVRVVISKDRLQAWVELPGPGSPGFRPPDETAIVSALGDKGIELSDAVCARLQQYLKILAEAGPTEGDEGPSEIPERFLIAEGQAPVEGQDGRFEWSEALKQRASEWQGDAQVNYYTRNSILTIEADTKPGRIVPPVEGRPGKDLFGEEVMPRRAKGMPIKLGNGLRTAEDDPQQIVTEVPGRLVQEGNTISMKELLKVPSDVDFKSGNVDAVIDVHICGNIMPNFSVTSSKSVTVERAVEAAEVKAEGNIQVRGGVFGHESGRVVSADGEIAASICDGAELRAGGDVCITKEIINSNIRTDGELRIEHGSIMGGKIYARNGAKVKHAGSDLGVVTRITVGTDGAVLYRAQQMDKEIKKCKEQAELIRARIKPLLENMKRLTAVQREQATELMAKADEIELATDDIVARRDQMLEQNKPDKPPGVEVAGTLYPGVALVFGLRETTIKTPVKGPVRVEERQLKGATEIAVVNQLTASVIPLPSVMVDVESFETREGESGGSDGAE